MGIIAFLLFFFFYAQNAFSFLGVEVIDLSKNKNTAILSVGAMDGVTENDYGKVYELDNGQAVLVADLEAVRCNDTYSYWIVNGIYGDRLLEKGRRYQFEFLSHEFNSRRPPVVKVKDILRNQSLEEEPAFLDDPIFEDEHFFTQDIDEERPSSSGDKNVIYEEREGTYQQTSEDGIILKPNLPAEIETYHLKDNLKKQSFNNEIEEFVKKFNSSKKGLAYNLDIGLDNDNTFMYPKPRNLDDPLWSKGLDQYELREFLMNSGMIKEKEYRERIRSEFDAHEFFLLYSTAFQQSTDLRDPRYRGLSRENSFGYELLLKRAHKKLEFFSLGLFYTMGRDFLPLVSRNVILGNSLNAQADHSSLGFNFKYYLIHRPQTVKKWMPFVGLGASQGECALRLGSFNNAFDCNLLSIVVNTGIKYRFGPVMPNSPLALGFSLQYGYRQTEYFISDQTDELMRESFDTSTRSSENKIYLGMNVYY